MANRAMYMGGGGGANGAADGVGHVQPLGYGSYGESTEGEIERARGEEREPNRETGEQEEKGKQSTKTRTEAYWHVRQLPWPIATAFQTKISRL